MPVRHTASGTWRRAKATCRGNSHDEPVDYAPFPPDTRPPSPLESRNRFRKKQPLATWPSNQFVVIPFEFHWYGLVIMFGVDTNLQCQLNMPAHALQRSILGLQIHPWMHLVASLVPISLQFWIKLQVSQIYKIRITWWIWSSFCHPYDTTAKDDEVVHLRRRVAQLEAELRKHRMHFGRDSFLTHESGHALGCTCTSSQWKSRLI